MIDVLTYRVLVYYDAVNNKVYGLDIEDVF